MAYPGEKEHAEYLAYVESQNDKGEPALPKDEWRKKKNGDEPPAAADVLYPKSPR